MTYSIQSFPLTLAPDTTVLNAVNCLNQANVGVALVVDQRLVGLFTPQNLVQAIATGADLATLTLAAVMTRSPVVLHESEVDNLAIVLQCFQTHRLQYLPIVNDQEQPVGVISCHVVLEALQNQVIDRQQTEAALQRSEQAIRLLLAANPNLMIRLRRDGTYLDFVPAKAFKSYTPICIAPGKTIFETMPPAFAQERMYYVERALQTQTIQTYEYELEVQGDRRYQEAQISVSGEDEVLIVVRDVTERKQAEAALRESEERLQTILESSPLPIFIKDLQGQYTVVNQAYEQMVQLSREQILAASDYDILPEDFAKTCEDSDRAALSARQPIIFEAQIPFPDQPCDLWITKFPLCDTSGQPYAIGGIFLDITNRKRMEEALQESSKRFQEIAATIRQAFFVRSASSGEYLYISPAFEKIWGQSCASLYQDPQSWLSAIHPDDRSLVANSLNQQFQGSAVTRQYRIIRPDGAIRWMKVDVSLVKDSSDQPLRFVGIIEDITERKQMEAALRQSEQRYRAIVEEQTELITRFRADTTITFVNEPFCRYFEVTPEEIVGYTYQPVIFPDDRAQVDRLLKSLSPENPVVTIENRVIAANGDVRWTQWINRVILDQQNQIVEFQAVGRDITDRKQIEIALQESEEKFRQLAFYIQDVFWILSPSDSSLLYVSPAFEKVWGRSSEIVYRDPYAFMDFIHPEDQERIRNAIDQRDRQGGDLDLEYRIVRPSGEIRWLHDRGFSICNEAGQIYRMVGVASDVTDRKQSEAALQQAKEAAEAANRAKSEFLSRMSHELRTPLTSVLGFAELIAQDTSLSAEHQENLAIIRRSGTHLLNLINSVLEMSRIEAGELTLNETSFDLYRLLASLRELLQLKSNSKGLSLSITWDTHLPQQIQTDENKLRQVLINLLDNAIKFTETGRVALWVSGSQESGVLRNPRSNSPPIHPAPQPPLYLLHFQVQDTGVGIAPEEMATLFQSFAQAEAGRKLQQGTGLGLAISRQFIQMMGGEIRVKSQVGQGTTLDFEIPVKISGNATETSAALSSASAHQRVIGLATPTPYRILIVDDQADTRVIVSKLLEPIGFEVQEATNGQEAIKLWESWQPHLIWMDMHMPVMNGYAAASEIRVREQKRVKGWNEPKRDRDEGLAPELDRKKTAAPMHASSHSPEAARPEATRPEATRYIPCGSIASTPSTPATKIIALTANAFDQQRSSALAAGCDDFIAKPFRHTNILEKIAEHLDVKYCYAEHQPCETDSHPVPSVANPSVVNFSLPSVLPTAVPATWSVDLRDAALRLSANQCHRLISQLPEAHSSLAQMLTEWVNQFQFEAVVDWIEHACDR